MTVVARTSVFGTPVAVGFVFAYLLTLAYPFDAIGQTSAEDPAELHLRQANAALSAKNFELARSEAKLSLKIRSTSAEANLALALAFRGLRKPGDTMKYARQAVKLKADYGDAHYLLAVLFYEKPDVKKSAAELDLAMQYGMRFANAYILKGTLALYEDHRTVAIESYREAVRLAQPDAPNYEAIKERLTALENIEEFAKHRGQPGYEFPVPLNNPMPRYTEDARQNHVQGTIRAAVLVDEQGGVKSVVLLTSLGHGLDQEAIRAASQIRFRPGLKNGLAVLFWQQIMVEFNLR